MSVANTTDYDKLITKKVDIHTFAQRYEPYGDRTMYDVAENVGIECLRKINNNALYSVHKVKQGGLLYVFYNYGLGHNGSIIRWFYVRQRLSFSDFENLTKDKSTIDDVIKINESEQIYLNIYRAHPETWVPEETLYTTHYLEDGILDVGYKLVDGKLIFSDIYLTENFDLRDLTDSRTYSYDAHILDIDWPKTDKATNKNHDKLLSVLNNEILADAAGNYRFASGVGGWSSEISLKSDGSFIGLYVDSDATNDTEYPNGTRYTCSFSGNFKITGKVDDNTYILNLEKLKLEYEVGKEWIADGVKYIATDAPILSTSKQLRLLLPTTPINSLSEALYSWWGAIGREENTKNIGCYGIIDIETDKGYFG